MDIEKTLEEIGFTKTETKVYLELLKLGKCKADEIIKRTGLYKSNVYQALNSLTQKGFVGEVVINNVKHFEAYAVDKVFDVLDEKKKQIDIQKEGIKKIIKEYQNKYVAKPTKRINLYSGNGVKTILYDILKTLKKGDIIYALGSRGDIMLEYFRYYFPAFLKQRVKRGIKFKGIYAIKDRKEFQQEIPPLTEAKFLNQENFPPMQTVVYKDKVVIFIVNETMEAILIENKNLAESYVKYFNFIWSSIKEHPLKRKSKLI